MDQAVVDLVMRYFSRVAVPDSDDFCLVLLATLPQPSVCTSLGQLWWPRKVLPPVALVREFFLGESADKRARWVLVVSEGPEGSEVQPLRSVLAQADALDSGALARAVEYAHWLEIHQFCGTCGRPTERRFTEFALTCPGCGAEIYPRISPCVIMLVHRGDEILLARHARSPSAVFSCLAGYVEAGETLEATVVREVQEEVGVLVGAPVYVESQPWPFPSQLMAGFFAPWKNGEPLPDGQEILEARWFRRDALPAMPPALSLARRLIRRFYHDDSL